MELTASPGGAACWTLPAGYLGSSLLGSLMVMCGFNTVASKVASIVIGVMMLVSLWWARRSWFTLLSVLFAVGMLVAFWFIESGRPLRFYVLFVGTMSALYALYDIMDGVFDRQRTSFKGLTLEQISYYGRSTNRTRASSRSSVQSFQPKFGALCGS